MKRQRHEAANCWCIPKDVHEPAPSYPGPDIDSRHRGMVGGPLPFSPVLADGQTAHGYLAVDLFFILSGFVLALNYAESFRRSLAGATDFYRLRFGRIYPLHFVMLMLFLLNPLAVALFSASGDTSAYGWDYFVLSLFLVQNWGFSTELAWNDPAWSISTEVFAYLFFPLAAMLMGRVNMTVGAALLVMVALLITLALAAQAEGGSLGFDIPGFGLTRCCLQFLLGMLVWRLRPGSLP